MKSNYVLLLIGIFFSLSIHGQNSVTLLNRPTEVVAGDSISFSVSYTKDFPTAKIMVKFHDTDTNSQLEFHVQSNITSNTGTLNFEVLAPTSVGTHYEIRAQLLDGWAGKASDNGPVSVVSNPPPPAGNSVTILNRPTTVVADELITFNVSYSKDFPTAKVLVKFQDTDTNNQLNFDIASSITADSGVIPLTVQAPSGIGSNYEIHAQLLEGWAGRASEIDGVTVIDDGNPPTGENTLAFVNPSVAPLTNGADIDLNVQYNVLETSKIVIRIHDSNDLANSNIIGEKDVVVQAGNSTIPINDVYVDAGWPGTNNVIEALLYVGNSTTPFPLANAPTIAVGKGDESRVTYRGQPQTFIDGGTTIYNYQNRIMERHMGGGYHSNFYVADGWSGPIDTKFSNLGTESWVDWDNNNNSGPHKEFDIKIQKYSWHDWFGHPDGVPTGYPKKYNEIAVPLVAEMDGRWNADSEGKCQINFTAWLYDSEFLSGGSTTPEKVDIIVHTFDNSGDFSAKYIRGDANDGHQFRKIGEFPASDNKTYEILRTVPGYFNEKASYNLIAKNGRQSNPDAAFPVGTITSVVDMEELIDAVIAAENTYTGPGLKNVFNADWYVHGMEWTVVGQSGAQIEADAIGDSKGRWTFEHFTIPDLEVAAVANRAEFVTTATQVGPINNGDIINSIVVKHNLTQAARLLVEIFDKGDVNDTTKRKIGQQWVDIPQSDIGVDKQVTVDNLVIDSGHPGQNNLMQLVLFDYQSWTPIALPIKDSIILSKGDGTITYRDQPNQVIIGNDTIGNWRNKIFEQHLGQGYWTNYYFGNWTGPVKMRFLQVNSPSWVEWDNETNNLTQHAEFDIKIQKFSWHDDPKDDNDGIDTGYPRALNNITGTLESTMTGQWSDNPISNGKCQINLTAWVTENGDMGGNRVDIIVHAFDNSGNFRKKYDDETDQIENGVVVRKYRNIGNFISNGLNYQILRTMPGHVGEVASYNLIPDEIVQPNPSASQFPIEQIESAIDMREIIDSLIVKESLQIPSERVSIDNTWFINGQEWTVVGQSGAPVDGVTIPDSRGRFTFNSFFIPNLNATSAAKSATIETKPITELVYPNPFSNSFIYQYDSGQIESVNLDLFSLDGRKVKTFKSIDNQSNSIKVDTDYLRDGLYILRIKSGDKTRTKKLIKN